STAGANGTNVWSRTDTTANTAATASNVLGDLVNTNSVTYTGANTGLGVAADGDSYIYNAASDSFSFNATGAADTDVAAYIQAAATAAGGSITVNVTIGGSSQAAVVDGSTGNLTTTDGQVLYLDTAGNLTTTNAGGETQAAIADVAAA